MLRFKRSDARSQGAFETSLGKACGLVAADHAVEQQAPADSNGDEMLHAIEQPRRRRSVRVFAHVYLKYARTLVHTYLRCCREHLAAKLLRTQICCRVQALVP